MKNSPRIEPGHQDRIGSAYAYIGGGAAGPSGIPASIVWRLEARAAARGWPVGRLIGTEADLMREFGAGRETLREAIRILQGRGSMLATRGRLGGLIVAGPDAGHAATSMAIYLHAVGCTPQQVAQAEEGLATLGGAESDLLLSLCGQVRARLLEMQETANDPERLPASSPTNRLEPRALTIAALLLREIRCAPAGRIGTEAALSERFMTSPETVRQALRILSDLDLLVTRKGRAGGAFPKQPQPIGVVRQFFAFLAVQRSDQAILAAMVATLNLSHLYLAFARLRDMPRERRRMLRREGEALLARSEEPMRYVLLQEFIGRIAGNAMIDTLLRCVVAYQVRVHTMEPLTAPGDRSLRTLESGLLAALCDLRIDEADHLERACHRLLRMDVPLATS